MGEPGQPQERCWSLSQKHKEILQVFQSGDMILCFTESMIINVIIDFPPRGEKMLSIKICHNVPIYQLGILVYTYQKSFLD